MCGKEGGMGLGTSMAECRQVLRLFLHLNMLLSTRTLVPGQGEVTAGLQTPARARFWGEGTV